MSAKQKKDMPWWQEWWRVFRMLLAVYVVLVLAVACAQRSIMYHPPDGPLPDPAAMRLGEMREVTVVTPDEYRLQAWFAPPVDGHLPVVVVFHGNGGSIASSGHIARAMLDEGYGVFLSEYRGYAGNPGSPTEDGLYNDGRGALGWLKEKGFGPDRLALYGESIGSGVAVQLASETQPKYLIVQSGFNSAVEVALRLYTVLPARLFLQDRYESKKKIGKVKSDLLVIHGDKDTLIPIDLAKDLFDTANEPKVFMTVPGAGHNDMYRKGAGPMITRWLNARAKKEPADEE